MISRLVTAGVCLLALSTAFGSADAQVRRGEHGMHSAIPDGFTYIPFPPMGGRSGGDIVPLPESHFPYDAHIMVTMDRPGPAVAIDSQYNRILDGYKKRCVTVDTRVLSQGTQNNYPYNEWLLTCDADKASGKSKFSIVKSIVAQSSVLGYQYEISSKPDDAAVKTATDYLDTQVLCDDTSASHPCQAAN